MHSARRGTGSDVAGSRRYVPGDDVKAIDWASSARLSSARGADEFVLRELYRELRADPGWRDRDPESGTVGIVIRDDAGRLVAASSTGGMMLKLPGRVGDTGVIGAGTYCDTCGGVSATGHGEYFIRAVVGHDIAARMRYAGMPLDEAAASVVKDELVRLGGDGGVIAVDRHGNVSLVFNTSGMYRGAIDRNGEMTTAIYATP